MKPWEKYAQAAQVESQASEGPKPWERYAAMQKEANKPGKLASFAAGAGQGATFGFLDEAIGAGRTAIQDIASVFRPGDRSPEVTRDEHGRVVDIQDDLAPSYEANRDQIRDYLAQAREANPKTFMAGEIGGGVASGIATGGAGVGASLGRIAAHGAAGGGLYAAGASEAENAGELVRDVATGAAVGGAGAGVLGGIGKAANVGPVRNLREKVAGKLKDFANKRFAKSVVGQNRKLERQLQREGRYEQVGRTARDEGIVEGMFGKNVQKMYRQVDDKIEDVFGPKYGAVYDTIDNTMGAFIDGDVIANEILDYAAQMDVVGNEAATEKMFGIAERLAGRPLTFREAKNMRQVFKYDPNAEVSRSLGKMGTNKINMAIGDGMKDAVERSGQMTREQLTAMNRTFRDLKDIQTGLETLVSRYGNRTFGLTDIGAGTAGAMATGNLGTAGVMAVGSKFLKERGSQMAAIGADKLGDIVQSAPQVFGRFAPMLEKAAERGQSAMGAAHYILWQNEPEYREMWEKGLAGVLDEL